MFYLAITLYQTYVFLLNKNSIGKISTNTIYNTTLFFSRYILIKERSFKIEIDEENNIDIYYKFKLI